MFDDVKPLANLELAENKQAPAHYSGHCPRCGGEHEGLPLALLASDDALPSQSDDTCGGMAWTMCPVLQQPLLVGWVKQTL